MSRRRSRESSLLPSLTSENAYMTVLVLEKVIRAIWRANGAAMADFQGRVFPEAPRPFDSVWSGSEPNDGEEELDF